MILTSVSMSLLRSLLPLNAYYYNNITALRLKSTITKKMLLTECRSVRGVKSHYTNHEFSKFAKRDLSPTLSKGEGARKNKARKKMSLTVKNWNADMPHFLQCGIS